MLSFFYTQNENPELENEHYFHRFYEFNFQRCLGTNWKGLKFENMQQKD